MLIHDELIAFAMDPPGEWALHEMREVVRLSHEIGLLTDEGVGEALAALEAGDTDIPLALIRAGKARDDG
ncbi:hypothetical protein C2R22_05855 [Salinigranum rubrum]|uniref:Uncharacterized protein n=1 Tax=Salinigranum rubrum TaxID=755307 RepID=A0A2I8VH36_9EURY|nr:hypothetical protein [Salinigranum rubrum]AUV81242.1 hypothetical protein C2R22_05855 [Salinigranum rubrum]